METEVFTGFGDADEMIRANGEAEAKENDRLHREVETYGKQLDEMKSLYLRNNELIARMEELCRKNSEDVKNIVAQGTQQMQSSAAQSSAAANDQPDPDVVAAISAAAGEAASAAAGQAASGAKDEVLRSIEETRGRLEQLLAEQDEKSHRDDVRVYRNVQASMAEELDRRTEELRKQLYALHEGQANLSADFKEAEDNILTRPEKHRTGAMQTLTFIAALLTLALVGLDFFGYAPAINNFFIALFRR